jgi:hypothetical protein
VGKTASPALLSATTIFTMKIPMKFFRRISSRSDGHGLGNKCASFHLFVMNYECVLSISYAT